MPCKPLTGPHPTVAVDRDLDEPAQWGSPKVSRQSDGGFVARLSPSTSAGSRAAGGSIEVSLGGLGWPRTGEGLGHPTWRPAFYRNGQADGETYTVSLTTSAQRVSAVRVESGRPVPGPRWLDGRWRAEAHRNDVPPP